MIASQADVLAVRKPDLYSGSPRHAVETAHQGLAKPDRILRAVAWAGLLLLAALTALHPLSEFDTWWHLRTGQWTVENGTVPTTDPFTTFGQDKSWVAYSWLYGLLYYGSHGGFGLVGILAYRVVLSVAILSALYRFVARREARLPVVAGLVGACGMALASLFLSDRPWLFTVLFCIWTLEAVLRLHEGTATKAVWLLPVVYALWANLHIQFVHGLLILGLACVAPLLDRWIACFRGPDDISLNHGETVGPRNHDARHTTWTLLALTGACFLATFVNPYGWRVYEVVREYSRQTQTYNRFAELRSLEFRSLADWAALGLTGAAMFALGRRSRVSTFDVLLLAAGAYFSFHSRHDVWFVVLAAANVFVSDHGEKATDRGPALPTWPQRLLVVSAVALLAVLVGWQRGLTNEGLAARMSEEFPVSAAAFVEEQGYAGPVYHHIDWGGYLIWRLPHLQATLDGRTNLHGDKRVERCMNTSQGLPGWREDQDLAAARLVILHRALPLASLLLRDGRFEKAYEDPLAVVFIARGTKEAAP